MPYQLTSGTVVHRLTDNAFIPFDPDNTEVIKNKHYFNRYIKFIFLLKDQNIDGYCEEHHIIPKAFGGSDKKENLIKLTARQHFVAHWILAKALGGSASRAFFMMSNLGKYGKVNSISYENARKEYAKLVSLQMKNKPINYVFTKEHRDKLSAAKKGKTLSIKTRQKIAKKQVGRELSLETKQKISQSKKNKICNSSRHLQITWRGKTQTRVEWDREFGLRDGQLRDWTRNGKLTIEEALLKAEQQCIK